MRQQDNSSGSTSSVHHSQCGSDTRLERRRHRRTGKVMKKLLQSILLFNYVILLMLSRHEELLALNGLYAEMWKNQVTSEDVEMP